MDQSPKVSIIMPVQNTAPYLHACINSIVRQTYRNWELIAVDDRSTDNSFEVLEEFAAMDARILALKSPGTNIIQALSQGYDASKGLLITRMDSDDIMPDYKIKRMVDELLHQEMGSVVSGMVEYFNQEQPLGDGYRKYTEWLNEVCRGGTYWYEIFKECVVPSACWMMHRSDFDAIGGFSHSRMPEDYDLCFRMWLNGMTPIGIPEVLHQWRDRSDRASRTQEVYRDHRFFEIKLHYFLKRHLENDELILWGAGKNGKHLAQLLTHANQDFIWVTNNPRKIGKLIYNRTLVDVKQLKISTHQKFIIAVANQDEQNEIRSILEANNGALGLNYWFFM